MKGIFMSLIYRRKSNQPKFIDAVYDYIGEIGPFARRINNKILWIPLVVLKSIEWSIYRWYKTPTRRFYGVKGNELIYMITSRCNERCAKCGIWKKPESDDERIDISSFINCLKTLNENLYRVTLTGGEPLLFMNDVLTIAEESRRHGIQLITVTNGSLITKEFLEQYAEFDHVLVISIDTLEKQKWKDFRGTISYDKVIENIILSKKIMGKNMQIQSVLAQESLTDIPKIISFCKKAEIKHVTQTYMDFGGVWNSANIINSNANEIACAARKNICIYPNGDVVKCFDHHRIPSAKEPLGNIGKEDIIQILCKKRSTEISKIMKSCNFPCKQLSCNLPEILYN
jgi:MoaA/NifB/PqqE/SkfB family radical SAM enzyme